MRHICEVPTHLCSSGTLPAANLVCSSRLRDGEMAEFPSAASCSRKTAFSLGTCFQRRSVGPEDNERTRPCQRHPVLNRRVPSLIKQQRCRVQESSPRSTPPAAVHCASFSGA